MHYLYIIYSKQIDRYYVGESPDIVHRIKQHNNHHFKTNFTKAANDWSLMLSFECKSKNDALFLERFIKRMKSRKFIQKVIHNPKILDDLLKNK